MVSWARFLCRACDAVTLEYDKHEGYQTVWPYPVLSGTGQCDDQILNRNDQTAAEEAIIAALYDLFDRPGHSTCPKTTRYPYRRATPNWRCKVLVIHGQVHRLELGEELCRRAGKRILFAVLSSCPSLVAA